MMMQIFHQEMAEPDILYYIRTLFQKKEPVYMAYI